MEYLKRFTARLWVLIRYFATGQTASRSQRAALTYYTARRQAGPSKD
ncbi:hypothetical protein [Streptomyces sp. SAS_275]